jgi:hypothetical protein
MLSNADFPGGSAKNLTRNSTDEKFRHGWRGIVSPSHVGFPAPPREKPFDGE